MTNTTTTPNLVQSGWYGFVVFIMVPWYDDIMVLWYDGMIVLWYDGML